MAQKYSYSRLRAIPMIEENTDLRSTADACYGIKNNFARDRSPDRVRIRLLIAKMRAVYELTPERVVTSILSMISRKKVFTVFVLMFIRSLSQLDSFPQMKLTCDVSALLNCE